MLSYLENLSGVQNNIINVLSSISGQPTNYFGTVSTSVDLVNFSNTVYALSQKITPLVVYASTSTAQAIRTSFITYKYDGISEDNYSMYNPSSGVLTIPSGYSGYLDLTATTYVSAAYTNAQQVEIQLRKNSNNFLRKSTFGNGGSYGSVALTVTGVPCVAGDTFDIRLYSDVSTNTFNNSTYNILTAKFFRK